MQGLASAGPIAYLGGVMSYFARLSPLRAYRDLRLFLAGFQSYHYKFMALSAAIVFALYVGFVHDSKYRNEYHPNIIYVQQWRADRTEAEIVAQQKIDKVGQDKRIAEQAAREKKLQEQFKKVDDKLKAWGF